MNTKFFKIALTAIVLLSSSIANAGILTVGDIVSDSDGVNWEYVGYYDMASGPIFNDVNDDGVFDDYAPIYTGISAAEENFGILGLNEYYAISTVETEVDHRAWYDRYLNGYVTETENFISDINNDDIYSQFGDSSAWVRDRALVDPLALLLGLQPENRTNFVFKSVNVPEPSSIAIFSLALLAFSRRLLKK